MSTTIQVSDDMRRQLKVLASRRDISYNDLLSEMVDIFDAAIPFQTEGEFAEWFEQHLDMFGYKDIIEQRQASSPDYRLETAEGDMEEVELELVARHFTAHGHDPSETDRIIALFSAYEEIQDVPVLSLITDETLEEQVIQQPASNHTSVSIPKELHHDVEAFIDDTGFQNVSEFARFLLRDIASQGDLESDEYLSKGVSRIRGRLRNLGYLPANTAEDD